jgi:hypothetical protein
MTENLKSGRCSVCSSEGETEIHHIVPKSLGGPDSLSNLIELCLPCHNKVHKQKFMWRQKAREGIRKRKEQGLYFGRKPSISREEVWSLRDQGFSCDEIAIKMGIGRNSAFRIMKERNNHG